MWAMSIVRIMTAVARNNAAGLAAGTARASTAPQDDHHSKKRASNVGSETTQLFELLPVPWRGFCKIAGRNRVRGVATASIWVTAAMDVLCGIAAWPILVVGVPLVLLLLVFGGPVE